MFLLSPDNFVKDNYQKLNKPLNKKITIIKFFAPWCGHCKNSQPEYELLDKAAGKDFNICMFDVEMEGNKNFTNQLNNSSLAGYKVEGFPTHVIFINGDYYEIYEGERSAKKMLNYLLQIKTAHN
jgi:protein disulfide-isomerase A6